MGIHDIEPSRPVHEMTPSRPVHETIDEVRAREMRGSKATSEPELAHQLELQRQYLDYLANSVEYFLQELAKVKYQLQAAQPQSGCTWYETVRELAPPVRPAALGASPIVPRTVANIYGTISRPQDKTRNSGG